MAEHKKAESSSLYIKMKTGRAIAMRIFLKSISINYRDSEGKYEVPGEYFEYANHF